MLSRIPNLLVDLFSLNPEAYEEYNLSWITFPVWLLRLPEAGFKEFKPQLIFKPGLKYGWFHIKLY